MLTGYLVFSRDISGCHNWWRGSAPGIWWAKASDAAKHRAMQDSPQQRMFQPKMSILSKLRLLGLEKSTTTQDPLHPCVLFCVPRAEVAQGRRDTYCSGHNYCRGREEISDRELLSQDGPGIFKTLRHQV